MTEPISRAWRQTPPSPSRRKFLNHLGQALSVTLLPGFASTPARAAYETAVEENGAPPTGHRLALLVCCGSYPDGKNIQPARKNGRDLEAALRKQKFEVQVENDLDLPRFNAAVEAFRRRMQSLPTDGKTIGLIYFCGHGMQFEGRNFLLPSDVATTDPKAKERSINLQDQVLAAFPQRYPGLGVAVIDACRDGSEQDDKTGAFNYSSAPQGCVVAFSASAGQVSLSPSDPNQNSFYTRELVKVLEEVNDEVAITDVFELTRLRVEKTMSTHPVAIVRKLAQRPHMTVGQTGVFRLGKARSAAATNAAEDEAWARQVAALTPAEVKQASEAYLKEYPANRYDTPARVALAGAEDALRALSSRFLRLSASGFRSAKGDPLFAEDLRKALRGDKDAAARISTMYKNGSNGVETNALRSEQWLRYSALLGNAIACYELYRQLAEKGDPDAEFFGPEATRLGYQPPKALCGSRKSENC